ncbi:MAG: hypothetical protein ABI073_05290 [Luteolibacter sp.]
MEASSSPEQRPGTETLAPNTTYQEIQKYTMPAIQLAENVQLPAALMIPGTDASGRAVALTPAGATAIKEISDSFYQEIADTLTNTPPQAPTESADHKIADEEDTVLITPSASVESARQRANELYHALFGNDTYNRQTMNSTIEVHLPSDSASGQ